MTKIKGIRGRIFRPQKFLFFKNIYSIYEFFCEKEIKKERYEEK